MICLMVIVMNNYIIYKHLFPNGKVYIGLTSLKASNRFSNGKGYKHNQYMQNAINKYNWENVKHFILFENLTKEEAEQKEIELISFYKSNNREYGYNIDSGGNSNGMHSEETRKKISENNARIWKDKKFSEEHKLKLSLARKGKEPWNKGKKGVYTEEQLKRISEKTKEALKSKEARLKISNSKIGNTNRLGKKHSQETKDKISASKRGTIPWNKKLV